MSNAKTQTQSQNKHLALCALYNTIVAARKAAAVTRYGPEWCRLTEQSEAVATRDHCFVDFDTLPRLEQIAVEIAVAAACVEWGTGAMCRTLEAARRGAQYPSGAALWEVRSKSTGVLRKVIVHPNGHASCGCPASSSTGCFHRTAAQRISALYAEQEALLDTITDDALDSRDPLTTNDRPLPSVRSIRSFRENGRGRGQQRGQSEPVYRDGWREQCAQATATVSYVDGED